MKYTLQCRSLLMGAALLFVLTGAYAQNVYRITHPDGRVTYSDSPVGYENAVLVSGAALGSISAKSPAASIDTTKLPFQVRQAHQSYPITLYTTGNCSPCVEALDHLNRRGVPFIEYTVATTQDVQALANLINSPPSSFPVIRIGSKALNNYNATEWDSYLDAAGYPKENILSPSYANPLPQPLTTPSSKEPEVRYAPSMQPIETTPAQQPNTQNPAGIRF